MEKRILVIMPRFPYPEAGACEQDRAEGLRQLGRLGYKLYVIAKFFDWQDRAKITEIWAAQGVRVVLIPYLYKKASATRLDKLKKAFFMLAHPRYTDGAVFEYQDPAMVRAVGEALKAFTPQLVWFDYTYLWPLYSLVKKKKVPFVVRSINFEADHFLDEEGRSFVNYLKYIPKYFTERITAHVADVLFSISPNDQERYRRLRASTINLPLRSLYAKLGTHTPKESQQLHVFFAGSTYTVAHNRRALEFIINEVAPRIEREAPGQFIFHILGAKFPEDLKHSIGANVRYEGFVENFEEMLASMDVALAPSFFGGGMQQKIFEPLARGFPTITHARGLAGYPFVHQQDVWCAETLDDYCEALHKLGNYSLRQELSNNSKKKSQTLFSPEVLDTLVGQTLESLSSRL